MSPPVVAGGPRAGVKAAFAGGSRSGPAAVALLALAGAGVVAYLTSKNPYAAPKGFAVGGRVLLITGYLAAGLHALQGAGRRRVGVLMLATALTSCLWLLNGSARSLPFTIGLLFGAAMLALNCMLLLSHPRGTLRSVGEARLLGAGTLLVLLPWLGLLLISPRAPLTTPLLRCGVHCPANLLFTHAAPGVAVALKTLVIAGWVFLYGCTAALLATRFRHASRPARSMLAPVALVAVAQFVLLDAYLIAQAAHAGIALALGIAYVAGAVSVPVAIFYGLSVEQMFLGDALATYVVQLAREPDADPQGAMAVALGDSTLEIVYRSEHTGRFVGVDGLPRDLDRQRANRSVVVVEHGGEPLAAVIFDAELANMRRFVLAAADAATLSLRARRLDAEVAASRLALQGSRRRELIAAWSERERIQRDLHDSAQQRLLAIRTRLRLAEDATAEQPARMHELIAELERELGETLADVRSATGSLSPPVLADYGLGAALSALCRRSSPPAALEIERLTRHPAEVENAVYFTCAEALQNVQKHAGPEAAATARVSEHPDMLFFEVSDGGRGFDERAGAGGQGLANMRSRIEAIGGSLWIRANPLGGTVVLGAVPVRRRAHAQAASAQHDGEAPRSEVLGRSAREPALARTLGLADRAAGDGAYVAALTWLDALEATGQMLPEEYGAKRSAWSAAYAHARAANERSHELAEQTAR